MSFSLNRFLRPLNTNDKVARIYDDRNYPVYTINPFSVLRIFLSDLTVNVSLSGNKSIRIDFKTVEEAKEALIKLQNRIDQLRLKDPEIINKETENYVDNRLKNYIGITSLNGSNESNQLIKSSDTEDQNLKLSLESLGPTHTINLSWDGLLPIERGGLNNKAFSEKEILIFNDDSIISSGYKMDDETISATSIWSSQRIIDYYNSNIVNKEKPSGDIDGENRVFVLSGDIIKNSEHVYLNGLLQDEIDDYTIEGNIITFDLPPYPGSRIRCSYIRENIISIV